MGDTVTASPALENPALQPDPVLEAVEALPTLPTGVTETTDVLTVAPSANGEFIADPKPSGANLPEGIIETVASAQGETPLVESGPDVISMGDGVIAVDNMETTTPITDVPMTTVDSNFDPQGTFDGRSDPILLTGTTLPANSSKVLGNVDNKSHVQGEVVPGVPEQNTSMAENRNEFPIGIEAETTTATLALETENVVDEAGATGINTLNEQVNPATEILTEEAIPDITDLRNAAENEVLTTSDLNTIDSIRQPLTNDVIKNTTEKPTIVDQTTPSEFMDVAAVEVPNYEEKLNEFKEFVKKNPNTKFPAPPVPPPRKPPVSQQTKETSTPLVGPDEIAINSTTESVPGPPLVEDTSLPPSEPIVRPEPSKPRLKTESVAKKPSRPPSKPLLPKENNVKEKSLPPSKPMLGSPKVALSNSGTKPKSTSLIKPRLKTLTPSNAVPSPPPPPSDVFRKDFNENTNKKAEAFKYEPKIPFDPDFDFKPNDRTKTADQRSTLIKTTNVPTTRQLDVDIQSKYDKNSRQNNAIPLSVALKRPQEPFSTHGESGISLFQYQLNNKNGDVSARRVNVRERNETPTKVRNQSSGQGSNDMQALFDKTRKFEANFGEPGMPISSNYFNQNHGGQVNSPNVRNQPFGTVWSPSSPRQQKRLNSLQSLESKNTMPPIVVVEDGSSLSNRNTASARRSLPVSVPFKQREFKHLNMARTNAPYTENKMGNSLEMWYQIMGKYLPKDNIKNFQNGLNVGTNAQNMGEEELLINTFWSGSNYKRNQKRQNPRLHNNKINNDFRKRAGGLAPISSQFQKAVQEPKAFVFEPKKQRLQIEDTKTVQRRTSETTAQVTNNNAIAFELQRQGFQIKNTKNIQRREPPKPTFLKNNAFEFEPQKQTFQSDVTKDAIKQLETLPTPRKQNAFIFEPQLQRSQIEVADIYRMKIKEILVTGKPNTVSTTEARLNTGVPTLSYSLEPDMFSQDNPPPINIDGKFDNIAFQSFITTTARPNTLPQPSRLSPSAFRIKQRNTHTINDSFRKSVASIANLPRPPPINLSGPSFPSTLNKPTEGNSVPSQKEKDNNVEPKLNAVPFVPAETMLGPKISKISDLPRPPAINFAGSLGSGTGKDSNIGTAPIAGAPLFREIPEVTPVPPLFSVNSTIIMKLQNDSVTKEELPSSKFNF